MDIQGWEVEEHPKDFHHGKTYWSKQHVEKHFAKHTENNGIVEWYSVPEMMEKFNMTTSAVYCFVSKFDIPKKKVKREVFYSKQHVDDNSGKMVPSVAEVGIARSASLVPFADDGPPKA